MFDSSATSREPHESPTSHKNNGANGLCRFRTYLAMKRLLNWVFLSCLTVGALANEVSISDKNGQRQQCAGIYSKQDWGGPKDTFIEVAMTIDDKGKSDDNAWIALVIYEYRNVEMLGKAVANYSNKKYICDDSAVNAGLCQSDHIGTFIVDEGDERPYAQIYTQKISAADPQAVTYPVQKTGYYCVSTYPSSNDVKYKGVGVYQNAFGQLAASEIPKLPFFGGAALAYLVVLLLWMFSYIQHRSDILPVQNYITVICGFLVVEMIIIWGYYEFVNRHGSTVGATIYLIVVSVLNSMRNAYTFFLLLIVCLGYGVVKPTLGSLMWKCQALGGAHFLFAILFTIASYTVSPDNVGPLVLLLILPMSLTMTAFYVWILSSLTTTIKYLEQRRQAVKANMYKILWRILLGSIMVIFAFFFIDSLIFAQESTLEFITNHWKSRWFMLDGWLNVVYFVDFCLIAFIWRPTANNRRFAMSSQLAQDEEGAQEFEIGSLRESLENDGDEETIVRPDEIPAFSPPGYSEESDIEVERDVKEPKATNPSKDQHGQASGSVHPNDAETMFAVDDDEEDENKYDKWDDDEEILSDDDEDVEDESRGLRKKAAK